ncbi:GEVED domain-containing protein [Rosistilla ulvae]|uniref:GEVED domain-containing protein n=1 Tax=Rosistilla ulvae TaxID=1930277 RepID=UPI001C54DED7|nr:GEVED domain-containing protein [Rosistilla ulvae]
MNDNSNKSRRSDRAAKRQRLNSRRSLLETLEGRQLLAAGPMLVGVQPDTGDLLENLDVLTTSPREITLRFDELASLDPASLDAIKIIRAGGDGEFASASAVTDLGSSGLVEITFEAVQSGSAGDSLEIVFTKANRTDKTLPIVSVVGQQIQIELNSNPSLVTRASDIQYGIAQNPAAAALLRVASVSGQTFFDVGRTAQQGQILTLQGSDRAQATSSLGAANTQVRFTATQSGVAGQNLGIDVRESFRVAGAPPIVSVLGERIEVLINSNPASRTTVGELVTAINNHPSAKLLVTAAQETGSPSSTIGLNLSLFSPIEFSLQSGNLDVEIVPGYVGFVDASQREVVFRFAEDLPQDEYRIEIDGSSANALQNEQGDKFNNGVDETIQFTLDLAPTIEAVVPQPIVNGQQLRDQIWVYFDRNDPLDAASARNAALYQLISTAGTETGADDQSRTPLSVSYNPGTGVAVLQFSDDLYSLFPGTDVKQLRLRVGETDVRGTSPTVLPAVVEPGDSFAQARDIRNDWIVSTDTISSVVIEGAIAKTEFINGVPVSNNEYLIDFPGGDSAPGVQEFRPEDASIYSAPQADPLDGISTYYYNFFGQFRGDDPNSIFVDDDRVLFNNITEQQKQRVREVLDLYSQYLGVQFVESADMGLQIAVGETSSTTTGWEVSSDLGVINSRLVDESDDDLYGQEFFQLANGMVKDLIGVSDFLSPISATADPLYPSPRDIIEGQYAYRPDSTDIDLYKFTVPTAGEVTIETVAERLSDSASLLDTNLRLYRELSNGSIEEWAANDDYWSEDSEITVDLPAGTYFIGVSASGNDTYDPMIEDSGIGGRSEGAYELRMSFKPDIEATTPTVPTKITDTDDIALDGDNDGEQGGAFDFWFESAAFTDTVFVKKDGGTITPVVNNAISGVAQGAVTTISSAISGVASQGTDIIRILPSGDGNLATTGDNLPYLIGFDDFGRPLADGSSFQVPKDVTVMIDSGAILKLRRARIGVGSSSAVVDASGGSLQVLGTPLFVGANGSQATATPVSGDVVFTSIADDTIGGDQSGNAARQGDWGGIDFRSDVDKADESRINYEAEGIFLNVVQYGDFRYGGGTILVESKPEVISPVELSETRATIANSTFSYSADAAIEASADTFQDDKFTLLEGQAAPDYTRVGPDIYDIQFIDNTINGMFIRSQTRDGQGVEKLTVQARFDDLDVVHVLAENLEIQGTPGGALVESAAPPTRIVRLTATAGGTLAAGEYSYRLSYVTANGNESPVSNATGSVITDGANGSILLEQLPTVPAGEDFVARRLYRSVDGGDYRLVATLNGSSTDFVDNGLTAGTSIDVNRPNVDDVTLTAIAGGDLPAGQYEYKISYVDANGKELSVSFATEAAFVPGIDIDDNAIQLDNLPTSLNGNVVSRRVYRSFNGDAFRMIAAIPNNTATQFTDSGLVSGMTLIENLRPRMDARLAIDAGVVVKLSGAFIKVEQGAQLIAEGTDLKQIVFTSLDDQRFGRGGTFNTNQANTNTVFDANDLTGDWGGIYVGPGAEASLDHTRITGAGGGARIDGKLAFFNPIEVHQGELRLTNSRLEQSGTGFATGDSDRAGLQTHNPAVVFVRGAQPIIASNTFINNDAVALNFDLNSLDNSYVSDLGTTTGRLEKVLGASLGNQGPLVFDNVLENNAYNGMEVRGGELAAAGVWDDSDIVHVVRGTISIPNHEVYGGLRLESAPDRSLVVKFDSSIAPATIIAGGDLTGSADQFNGLADRVGGALQVIGQPGKSVILTSISDDTVGSGFDTQGKPQTDTDNSRNSDIANAISLLPTGPEVARGTIIDNDVLNTVPGHFSFQPVAGGGVGATVNGGFNEVTTQGVSTFFQQQNALFDYLNYIDVGADGAAVELGTTTITTPTTLLADDVVYSEGTFTGENGLITWRIEQSFQDGSPTLITKLTLDSDAPLGDLRFINYYDPVIASDSGDLLFTEGTPGTNDYRVTVLDGDERVGFRHYGTFENGTGLVGANYEGWIADEFPDLITAPEFSLPFTPAGTIDTTSIPLTTVADLPAPIYGPAITTTAHAWLVNPTSTSVTITAALELIEDEFDQTVGLGKPGDWDGIVIREAALDRNVEAAVEQEGDLPLNRNDQIELAQFLGELAPTVKAGSENRRIGFQVYGNIDQPSDVDVYSFDAEAGTEVWLEIDRTDSSLDSVLELVRLLPNGSDSDSDQISDSIVAISNGSIVEALDSDLIIRDENAGTFERTVSNGQVNSLDNSMFSPASTSAFDTPQDLYSTNPHDPGLRVVLPGETGEVFTYQVRVRSSNLQLNDPVSKLFSPETGAKIDAGQYDGLTSGPYELSIRLAEADETAGSYLNLVDIRYATTGVTVIGQPFNSPLLGDAVEFIDQNGDDNNDTLATAQPLGPYGTQTDPNSSDQLSVAGAISSATDIDWFEFSISGVTTQSGLENYVSTIFDLDYADGLGRGDFSIWVFDETGQLILTGLDSNVADDQPGNPNSSDFTSLSRGSTGNADPFIGPVELIGEGTSQTYYVAISGINNMPSVLDQFTTAAATNPLVRLEPAESIIRIVEDHVGSIGGSTAAPTVLQTLLFDPATAATGLTLNDLKLYVSTGGSTDNIRLVNAYTGQQYGVIGSTTGQEFNDIAIRPNGDIFGYNSNGVVDDASWHYYNIDTGFANTTDLTPTGTNLITNEALIAVDAQGNVTATVVPSDTGVTVNAISFDAINGSERGFIVGDRGPGVGVDQTQNLLWQFNPTTGLIQGIGGATLVAADTGGFTDPRERGYIETGNPNNLPSTRLGVTAASVANANGFVAPSLTDGVSFTIRDFVSATSIPFQFDLGSAIQISSNVSSGVFLRDGETITIGGQLFEFDTGVRLDVVGTSDPLSGGVEEGSRVTLTSKSTGLAYTFEFDSDGIDFTGRDFSRPDLFAVDLTTAITDGSAASVLASAINAAGVGIRATSSNTGEIVLTGTVGTAPSTGLGITSLGADGITSTNATAIVIDDDLSSTDLTQAISSAIRDSQIAIATAGTRIDFTDNPDIDLDLDTPLGVGAAISIVGTANTAGGPTVIPFDVDDTAAEIGTRIVDAIQAAVDSGLLTSVSAAVDGNTVVFNGANVLSANNPLTVAGIAPGGTVTGIATPSEIVNGVVTPGADLYAVSNQGGLYRIDSQFTSPAQAWFVDSIGAYVETATDLLGINFTGLSAGPENVEGGKYADLLFGITGNGDIYAFNTRGELQPVFANGSSRISTGVFGATGFDFSNLDYNLWHVTGDTFAGSPTPITLPGHGINSTFNDTRNSSAGGTSWYFGLDDAISTGTLNARTTRVDGSTVNGTYDFAGGAHGEIVSNAFSLEGYNSADLPTFYFNYFLETDSDGDRQLEDSLRVYLVDENGTEYLLSTNSDSATASVNNPNLSDLEIQALDEAQETFDNTGTWRQARIPLDEYAGLKDLKLRFEFSTSGSLEFGQAQLQAVAGEDILDGDRFRVSGRDYEFVLSPLLVIPDGNQIVEGETITIDDVVYQFTTDATTVASPLVPVEYSVTQTGDEIAQSLRDAIANYTNSTNVDYDTDADASQVNDNFGTANPVDLPGAMTTVTSTGSIGTSDGSISSLDVDMLRLELAEGQTILLTIDEVATAPGLNPIARLFNDQGMELEREVSVDGQTVITFEAPADGTYYIGISGEGNGNYDPTNNLSGRAFGKSGAYSLNIESTRPYDIRVTGNQVILNGTGDAEFSASSSIQVTGNDGASGIPVLINRDMTPAEVATAIADAISQTLGDGQIVTQQGAVLTLPGLSINSAGPLSIPVRTGDAFGAPTVEMARDNDHRGVYLDDFIIGFRERGEFVTSAGVFNDFVANNGFDLDGADFAVTQTGEYQLEIRGASEYVLAGFPTEPATLFRSFDTNDRLVQGVTLEAISATDLDAAATALEELIQLRNSDPTLLDIDTDTRLSFTLNDGQTTITFEFVNESSGIEPLEGNVPIYYNTGVVNPISGESVPDSAADIAAKITDAINLPEVQALLDISALGSSGETSADAAAIGDFRINLSGNVNITENLSQLSSQILGDSRKPGTDELPTVSLFGQPTQTLAFDRRGDANTGSEEQGVIKIEGVSVSYSANFGIELDHGNDVGKFKYPKNLVELNSYVDAAGIVHAGLAPGVVVQSNLLAFNDAGGINVVGIDTANGSQRSMIAYDRIVNNTIVGGTISPTSTPEEATYGGTVYSQGSISFADVVVQYDPSTTTPPALGLQISGNSLGVPNYTGGTAEPTPNAGQGAVSLGGGGSITVQFVDNRLVGSGDASPDLEIFEVGNAEPVSVEVSIDGVNFVSVGTAVGGNNQIDIDRYGFGPNDRISFVRITDQNFGSAADQAVGADIDAVGAISSVPADQFVAGGTGIELSNGVSPTLLNNVFVNNRTAIDAAANNVPDHPVVLGANTFQANTFNLNDPSQTLLDNVLARFVDASTNLFVSPTESIFIPSQGSDLIDSSINSLDDRPQLQIVRETVGLLASPVLAPNFDANGALRIDDPTHNVPGGQGSLIYKDRGAFDRGDLAPPRGIVTTPLDNSRDGSDIDPLSDSVQILQSNKNYFEILLVDGGEPANPRGGVGIKDSSVTSNALLLFKDNVPLIEGEDYIFAYDTSGDVIRLTPLAGRWEPDSVYRIELLNDAQAVLNSLPTSDYTDGDQIRLIDSTSIETPFEIERGILVTVPALAGDFANVNDGDTFTIFDGVTERTFEFDTNGAAFPGNIAVSIPPSTDTGEPQSVNQVSAAITAAIQISGLNVQASDLGGQVQLFSDNRLTSVSTDTSTLTAEGSVGVSTGYGIQIPNTLGVAEGITDGQQFSVRRGDGRIRFFEIDLNGSNINTSATPIQISSTTDLTAIAIAIRDAITLSDLGLNPSVAAGGQILLPKAADVTIDLTDSVLTQIGQPGDEAAIPIVLEGNLTSSQVGEIIVATVQAADLPGITLRVIGDQIIVKGAQAVSGAGAERVQAIMDNAGNTLASNDPATGTTQFTIFVSDEAGLDYGDAPDSYGTLEASDGARHTVTAGFSLGATATPESDARLGDDASNADSDIDDGVAFTATSVLTPSGTATLQIDLTNTAGLDAILDAWIDWNQDGQFSDSERLNWNPGPILASSGGIHLQDGTNTYSIEVPHTARPGTTYGRFRLSSTGVSSPVGKAADGEVEDIVVNVQQSTHQNPTDEKDVNGSGDISPIDVLQVINAIGRYGSGQITSNIPSFPYIDVNGNGQLEPVDALIVLNYLNNTPANGEGEGFGWIPAANGVLTPEFMDSQDEPTIADAEQLTPASTATASGSVFDSAASGTLDDVIGELASEQAKEEPSAIDDFFANISFE